MKSTLESYQLCLLISLIPPTLETHLQKYQKVCYLLHLFQDTNIRLIEHIQIMLSENMKKWNQLIMNLHTEVSLSKSYDNSTPIHPMHDPSVNALQPSDSPLGSLDPVMADSVEVSQGGFLTPTPSSSSSSVSPATLMRSSASDTMLYPTVAAC